MGINKIKAYPMPKRSELPENKIKWALKKEDALLLIHDMQEYFMDAYDRDQAPYTELIQNIKDIKDYCKKEGIPVVYSAQPGGQTEDERGLLLDFWGHGIPANEGKEYIIDALKPEASDRVITKWRYSAFERTPLEELMGQLGKTQLLVTGVYGHIGCLTTAVNASMKNIKPFLISDAMADFSRVKHEETLEYVSKLAGMVIDTCHLIEEDK